MAGWLTTEQKLKLAPKMLKVINKQGQLVPLHLNYCQNYLLQNESDKTQCLKFRQGGLSTAKLADYFLDCITPDPKTDMSNITAVIFSYDDEATQRLLGKVDTFYDNLPEPKPHMGRDSIHLKTFPELGSRLYIGTAGARIAGLGDTVNRAHLSEFSYWSPTNANRILGGLEQAVPMGDKICIENTANGEGGLFYDMWNDEGCPYKKIFLPWYWHEEYTLEAGSPILDELHYFKMCPQDKGALEYNDEEAHLVSQYGLNEAQIRWRRMKKAETKEFFLQWYPEDPITCFLSSGMSIFNTDALGYMAKFVSEPPVVGQEGTLKQWELPRFGEKYIIGVDSADPDPGNPKKDGDWCGAVVMSSRFRHVATLWGKWPPAEFAYKVAHLGRMYNDAFLVLERNGIGAAVAVVLEEVEHYPALYKTGERVGWISSLSTKSQLVSIMKDTVDSMAFHTRDENLLRQLRIFRRIGNKFMAKEGEHDDLTIAFGLCLLGVDRAPLGNEMHGGPVRRSEAYRRKNGR